jgi:signal transduction histidine kinase
MPPVVVNFTCRSLDEGAIRHIRYGAMMANAPAPIPQRARVKLEDVLITGQLYSRPQKTRDPREEAESLQRLARVMARKPHKLVETLLEMALSLCGAGTAGISLLEERPGASGVFRWTHLKGTLEAYVGKVKPKNFSPSAVCLDLGCPQLFSYPARYFKSFRDVNPAIVESLIFPLPISEEIQGTLWIVSHHENVKFDSEDVRLMTALAEFTSCGLHLLESIESERTARKEREDEIESRKRTEILLRQTQSEMEAIIDDRTEQLRHLSARVISLQDEERRRIARELHDSAGQYLAAIEMNLSGLSQNPNLEESVTRQISDSLDLANRCTSEVRTISYLLHPPLLDEMGLVSALAWYVEGFAERSGIKVQLETPKDLGRLPRETETVLFRVVQQSLANIHRHSGSHVARIRMEADAESVHVEICDEGRGIDPDVLKGFDAGRKLIGVGIAGMRERVRVMGGRFSIKSNGNGTTLDVRLPMAE